MKLYLWDQAATVFYKFTASADTSVILLVMTLNRKRIRGTLALSSISSSHDFIDKDSNPQSTTSIVRLNSNPEFAKKVNA